jgi:hypothetical protein
MGPADPGTATVLMLPSRQCLAQTAGRTSRPPGRRRQADPEDRARSGHRHGIPLTCKHFGPKGVNVTDIQIETQYSTGASRQAIEQALVAAG